MECVEEGCTKPRSRRYKRCGAHVYERSKAYQEKYREENRDTRQAANRLYYDENRDRLVEAKRRYRKEHPEKVLEIRRRGGEEAQRRRERDSNLRRLYGITIEEYEAVLESQNYECAICQVSKPTTQRGWHVDHCHQTGKVRGVLCGRCNTGLGMFRDSLEFLRKAVNYLER